jgi:putative transposase
VRRLCRLYGVSRSGVYARRRREESARVKQDRTLTERIQGIWEDSRGTYGSPRVHRALLSLGEHVSRRRVERLMGAAGLRARVSHIYRSKAKLRAVYRMPNRQVTPTRRDQVWVGDITYLSVAGRWRYLAVVMDRFSRRVLGWSLGRGRGVHLTRAALTHAVQHRDAGFGLIFHSDRGCEYAGLSFRKRLESLGIEQSMNQRALGDNAHMESFFHSLKADIIHGVRFDHDEQILTELRSYMWYYNHRRLHSGLDYRSPVDFEQQAA